jgi:hypothetical protein
MKAKCLTCSVLLIFTAAMMSCQSQESDWKGIVEVSDGIKIVSNPLEPIYEGDILSFEEDLVIEGSEEDEAQMFQNIVTFDVDPEGNIYVLDEQACNVKVFDPSGSHLRTLGQKGQGPGEFAIPIALVCTPQGELLVNDMGNRKLVFLSPTGDFIKQISIADKFLFIGPRILADDRMIASFIKPAEEPKSELHIFNSDLHSLDVVASLKVGKPPKLNYFVGMQLTSLLWNVTYAGEIVWGDFLQPDYELFVYSSEGDHSRTISRDLDPLPITAVEQKELLDKMFGNNPAAQNQWEIEFPENYPPFRGISFDDEGRLYIKTYDKTEYEGTAYYDIFDADGRYIAKILFEFPPMIMKNGFLYTIEENADGFKLVKRYKMVWELQPVE